MAHDARRGVAQSRPAPMAHVHRAGGVGGDVLEVDLALPLRNLALAEVLLASRAPGAPRFCNAASAQADVDEAGTGDVDGPRHQIVGGNVIDDDLGNLARVLLRCFGATHGHRAMPSRRCPRRAGAPAPPRAPASMSQSDPSSTAAAAAAVDQLLESSRECRMLSAVSFRTGCRQKARTKSALPGTVFTDSAAFYHSFPLPGNGEGGVPRESRRSSGPRVYAVSTSTLLALTSARGPGQVRTLSHWLRQHRPWPP